MAVDSVEVDDSTRCAYQAALEEWRAESKDVESGVLPVAVLDEKSYEIAKTRAQARG